MAISQIYGLLWELIFGRWGLGRSISIPNGNFSDSCSDCSYFILTQELKIWQTSSWTSPLQMAISQIPALLWGVIFAEQVLADLPSLSIGNFTDSCSDCLYFILPLRAQHLAGHGLAHLSLFQMAISQIPALTTHISFLLKSSTFGRPGLGRSPPLQMAFSHIPALLWEFIFGRPSVGKSTPPLKGNFTDSCSDCPQFFPTLRAQHLADQV